MITNSISITIEMLLHLVFQCSEKGVHYSPGSLRTHNPSSASQVLVLETCEELN